MRRLSLHLPLALCMVWLGIVPAVAAAQRQEVRLAAAAREFFAQGISFADKSEWESAADRFRRALAIRHSSVIAFNLASSLEELGQLLEASELLYGIDADPEADATLRQSARALIAEIKPRLGSVMVAHPNDPGMQVVLDGAALSSVQIGVPMPIDPGTHVVGFQRGSQMVQRDHFELAPGESRTVSLAPPVVPTPAEVAARAQQDRDDADLASGEPPVTQRWWFWAGVGTVLAGTVAAVTIATLSGSNQRVPEMP